MKPFDGFAGGDGVVKLKDVGGIEEFYVVALCPKPRVGHPEADQHGCTMEEVEVM
jgi:hypothetical protein